MSDTKLIITQEDINQAGFRTKDLKPCPFCGTKYPITMTKYNPSTNIYRVEVHCTNDLKCGVSLGYNSRDKVEARTIAIEAWNLRRGEENDND